MKPTCSTQHSVQQGTRVLSGGSAYGLAAADGVMRWLEERRHGIPMGAPVRSSRSCRARSCSILHRRRLAGRPPPTSATGADRAATTVTTGCVGAGTGARAGVLKGGVGTASAVIEGGPADGITVSALLVANPVGSVWDPETGLPWGLSLADAERRGMRLPSPEELAAANALAAKGTVLNTTIGVVATDAKLSKASCRRVAVAGHDGMARAIRPAHSPLDGDTIFASPPEPTRRRCPTVSPRRSRANCRSSTRCAPPRRSASNGRSSMRSSRPPPLPDPRLPGRVPVGVRDLRLGGGHRSPPVAGRWRSVRSVP
ncbi:hypothetical protein GS944_02755 [Rhodococcus hoagii]|nr:hypothetical protein [Prescottella equi]